MEQRKSIVVADGVYRPIEDTTLNDADIEKALDELNETPERRVNAIEILKEMIEEEEGLNSRQDDPFLLRFLRCRKFRVKETFKLLKKHYKCRLDSPELFQLPSTVSKLLESGLFNYLPYRDHEGRAVFVVRHDLWDPSEFSCEELYSTVFVLMEFLLENPVTQINGLVSIWDVNNFTVSQAASYLAPIKVKRIITCFQQATPMRQKGYYGVNSPSLVYVVWNGIKPLLPEKIRNRSFIWGADDGYTNLHEMLDPAILPKYYGGQLPDLDPNVIHQEISKKESYFVEDRKYGYCKKP